MDEERQDVSGYLSEDEPSPVKQPQQQQQQQSQQESDEMRDEQEGEEGGAGFGALNKVINVPLSLFNYMFQSKVRYSSTFSYILNVSKNIFERKNFLGI